MTRHRSPTLNDGFPPPRDDLSRGCQLAKPLLLGPTMSKTFLCAVVAVTAMSSIARADDGDSKSELAATALSAGGTLAGGLMLTGAIAGADSGSAYHAAFPELLAGGLAGLAVGPSLGRWYARDGSKKGLVLRTVGLAGLAAGFAMYQNGVAGAIFASSPVTLIGGLAIGGASVGVLVAGTAMDIWGAHSSVRRYNRSHGIDVALAPMVMPHGGNGLAVVGTF